jgi:hypothetical protein
VVGLGREVAAGLLALLEPCLQRTVVVGERVESLRVIVARCSRTRVISSAMRPRAAEGSGGSEDTDATIPSPPNAAAPS